MENIHMLHESDRNFRKRTQNFSEWAGKTNRSLFVFNFNLDLAPLFQEEWSIELADQMTNLEHAHKLDRIILQNKTEPDKRVLIDLSECDSLLLAHERIIDEMAQCTIPRFPTGKDLGCFYGDVCFGSIWSRFNMTLSVGSIGAEPLVEEQLKEINQNLDKLIYSFPKNQKKPVGTQNLVDEPFPLKISFDQFQLKRGEKSALKLIPSKEVDSFDFKKISGKIAALGGEISRQGDRFYYHAKYKGIHNTQAILIGKSYSRWIGKAEVQVSNS
ncbi:MAG: hypothetical protein ACFFBD_28705 [Candidatus Hodarchaeota archaeon]